ncbi:response regulator [Phreatobacter sp.]|uniref:response regulator n=1 Tax=Phreatobacter sp. TaxID=1966341 RepID=UPI003F72BA4E
MNDATMPTPGDVLAGRFLVPTARRLRSAAVARLPSVLICEDDPLLAMELEAEITEAGAVCCGTAATFDEAVRLAGIVRPDIALVDLNLADGPTGASLADALHGQGARILVLSGDREIHPQLGRTPHVFLSKPVPPAVLQDVLKTMLMPLASPLPVGTEWLTGR